MSKYTQQVDTDGICLTMLVDRPGETIDRFVLPAIKSVEGKYDPDFGSKLEYRYAALCQVTVRFYDPDWQPVEFDVQDVSNQAGWTADQAGVDQATADICSWIAAAISGGGSLPPGAATSANQLTEIGILNSLLAESKLDFEMRTVRDSNGDLFQLRGTLDEEAGTTVWDYIDATGAVAVPVGAVTFLDQSSLLSQILTEVTPTAGTVNSSSGTGAGNTTLGAVAVGFSVSGSGAVVNGVARPDGWNFVYEAGGKTLPVIAYTGSGTATITVDEII